MWAAILPALVSAAAGAGFNALSDKGSSQSTTPVTPPPMEQPDILGQLMQLMQNGGKF